MRPDQDKDWKTRLASLSAPDRGPRLKEIQRAALSAAEVTGDQHWDLFLSIVQKKIEDLRSQVENAMDSMRTSDIFTSEGLINEKLTVRLVGRELEALEWVISLPQQLMDGGEKVKQLTENKSETSH